MYKKRDVSCVCSTRMSSTNKILFKIFKILYCINKMLEPIVSTLILSLIVHAARGIYVFVMNKILDFTTLNIKHTGSCV